MPEGPVLRTLFYVGFTLLFTLAATFPFFVGARVAKVEYRGFLSALACTMRIFFYSICLLSILVVMRAFDWAPHDPRSTLFGWIHIGGTIWIAYPSGWRAFHQKGPRMVIAVTIGLVLSGLLGLAAMHFYPPFAAIVHDLPHYLARV